MLTVALDGNYINRLRLVGMHIDNESEVGRQVAADLAPLFTGVVAAHHVPMLLHEQHAGSLRIHGDMMDTMPDLGRRIGNVLRMQPLVDGLPGHSAVVAAKRTGGRYGNVQPLGIARIKEDGVQAHATCARLPLRSRPVSPETGKLMPAVSAVGG